MSTASAIDISSLSILPFLYVFDFVPLRKHLKLFNIHKFPFFASDSCDEWTSAGCSECVTLDDVTSDWVTVIRIAGE